jgi:hypothetical protein
MADGGFLAQSFQHLVFVFLLHTPKILFFYIIFVLWFSNKYQWEKGNFLRHIWTLFTAIFISSAIDFALFSPNPDGYKNIWMSLYDIGMTATFAYLSFFSSQSHKPVKRPHPVLSVSDLKPSMNSPGSQVELTDKEKILKCKQKLATEARYSPQSTLPVVSGLSLQEVISKKLFKVSKEGDDFLVYFANGAVGLQDGLDLKVFPNEADCFSALNSLHRLKYLPYGASTSIPLSALFT